MLILFCICHFRVPGLGNTAAVCEDPGKTFRAAGSDVRPPPGLVEHHWVTFNKTTRQEQTQVVQTGSEGPWFVLI